MNANRKRSSGAPGVEEALLLPREVVLRCLLLPAGGGLSAGGFRVSAAEEPVRGVSAAPGAASAGEGGCAGAGAYGSALAACTRTCQELS